MKVFIAEYNRQWNVGMGDTIDYVSMINQLSLKEKILVPTQRHYMANVKSFFDNPNVEIMRMTDFDMIRHLRKQYKCIEATGDKKNNIGKFEVEEQYISAGCDFDNRIKYDSILSQSKKFIQIEPPTVPYTFVSDEGSCGTFRMNRDYMDKNLMEIHPPKNAFMLSYCKILQNATRIDCVPSGFYRLIDKLPTKGKLVLHNYARATITDASKWKELKIIRPEWIQLL